MQSTWRLDWGLIVTTPHETPQQAARRLMTGYISKGYEADALHVYTDIEDNPLHWRIRLKNKTLDKIIRPMRLNDDGTYELKEPSYPNGKPLYSLYRLAANKDKPVFIVEGEKCADYLNKLGLLASTSGSVDSVKTTDWEPLAGREVIAWRDNDNSGIKWQADLIATLHRLHCKIKWIDLEALNLPAKGDCVDWLAYFERVNERKAVSSDIFNLPMIEGFTQAPTSDLNNASGVSQSIANNNGGDLAEWGEPLALIDTDTAPEAYPIKSLPVVLLNAVKEVQCFVKAPISMVATSALAALAVAGQGQVNIKRAEKLIAPCSLFTLALAESGERKSTIDGFFTRTITEYEAFKRDEAKPDIETYKADIKSWQSKQAGKLEAIKQASKSNKSTLALENELRELENLKPIEPKFDRLIYGDTTPEQLAYSLATKWPTGAVISSEAGVVFGGHAMGGDSVMRNMAVLNVLWDGGTHTVDRRTSESFMVRNARLSMSLSIQPVAILEFLRKYGDIARGSGFLARFLIAWPESTQGYRHFEDPPETWPALAAFNTRIRAILDMPLPFDDTGNGLTPTLLELSPEAKEAWISFYNTIENELKQDGELAMVRDVASKTADNAARIAGLFHLLQHGTVGPIKKADMQAACNIAMWHLSESRRFLIGVSQSPELSLAVMLDEWLIKRANAQKVDNFSTSHLLTHAPNKLRRKATLYPALDELVDSDRVKLFDDGKVRTVFINPKLLEMN